MKGLLSCQYNYPVFTVHNLETELQLLVSALIYTQSLQ